MTTTRTRSSAATWTGVTALYTVLALLYVWPLLPAFGSALPSDTGDPGLVTWILWWNAHAVPLTAGWWNAPAFFPVTGAFALSETLLGLTPITTPAQWLGLDPIAAYNLSYLASFPAAAIAAHALAHRLTGRHDAAFIAGLSFGFSPYRADQMPHLQMLWSCWMPVGLLALHRFLAARRRRDLALLGLSWLLNGLSNGYYLFFFAPLVGLWMIWFVRRWRDAAAIAATVTGATLLLAPLLLGYVRRQAALGLSRGIGDADFFGADVTGLWRASGFAWLPSHWTFAVRPEGQLYPGIAIVVLAVAGVAAAWTRWPPRGRRTQIILLVLAALVSCSALVSWAFPGLHVGSVGLTTNHPSKTVTIAFWLAVVAGLCDRRLREGRRVQSRFLFYVVAAIVMLILALGPTGRIFDARFLYKAPYAWLMELPGGHALRVPARFAMLFILCLGQTAAIAFGRLTTRRRPAWLLPALACGILLDGWVPRLPLAPAPVRYTLNDLADGTPVLELPARDLYTSTAAMLRQTRHGHPIVTGASGYDPPHYVPLFAGLHALDPGVVTALRHFGPVAVVVDRAADADGEAGKFAAALSDIRQVGETPVGPVYLLPATPASVDRTAAGPVGIAAVHAAGDLTGLMTDGRVDTAWVATSPQRSGDIVSLELNEAERVEHITMDLGSARAGYPRRLRVSAEDGAGGLVTAWEGSTAGLAVTGALADPVRMPVTIDLPAPIRTRRLVLTLTMDDADAHWAIAEIRVFGPR